MTAEVHVLSGSRAGLVFPLSAGRVTVGRHPDADLRFHPEGDLDVSARHAEIAREGGGWRLRDLGSRNGTWVNGERVAGEAWLRDGDRVAFGRGGPVAEFRHRAAASPTVRVRAEVARQTRRLRRVSLGLALLLAGVVGVFLAVGRMERAAGERERGALRSRADSIRAAGEGEIRSLRARVAALVDTLGRAQAEVREARAALADAERRSDTVRLPTLRRRLRDATATLERRQVAAGLDVGAIQRGSRPAVALIHVESETGEVVAATAFAVRRDAVLLTNRHVVAGADGTGRPRRIAVQFSASDQVWPARLLAVSDEADLALVKVDNVVGDVPTVRALNLRADTLPRGAPVAIIGFPLGRGMQPEGRTVRPLLFTGTIRAAGARRLEVQGFGAVGASGSPILDARGEVIGVLYGGRPDPADPLVFGAPAAAAARLLARVR